MGRMAQTEGYFLGHEKIMFECDLDYPSPIAWSMKKWQRDKFQPEELLFQERSQQHQNHRGAHNRK